MRIYEQKGMNPFKDVPKYKLLEIRCDNTNRQWFRLEDINDVRNTLEIVEDELMKNFVAREYEDIGDE